LFKNGKQASGDSNVHITVRVNSAHKIAKEARLSGLVLAILLNKSAMGGQFNKAKLHRP